MYVDSLSLSVCSLVLVFYAITKYLSSYSLGKNRLKFALRQICIQTYNLAIRTMHCLVLRYILLKINT